MRSLRALLPNHPAAGVGKLSAPGEGFPLSLGRLSPEEPAESWTCRFYRTAAVLAVRALLSAR